jgi:hypothetical protein
VACALGISAGPCARRYEPGDGDVLLADCVFPTIHSPHRRTSRHPPAEPIVVPATFLLKRGGKEADPKTTKQDDDLKPLTVVGCLQPGAQANQFVLAATPDAMAKGVAVATSGAVPNVTYLLSGGTNLAAHVGHRVEITGRTSGQAQKAESTDSNVTRERVPDKPDPKVETKEKASIEMRDLRIESLKMVSTSCAAK